jgi:hypothetical protein
MSLSGRFLSVFRFILCAVTYLIDLQEYAGKTLSSTLHDTTTQSSLHVGRITGYCGYFMISPFH